MKKYFLFLIATGFIACQNQTSNDKAVKSDNQNVVANAADQKLYSDASAFFKPLPAFAASDENQIIPEKVALGKKLYYDNRLSKTGNNSCNSCHNLATYGVDNKPTSSGDAGKNGERNSPTVLNAALHTSQFWDGRAKNVEEQAGMPILNPVEMAMPTKVVLEKKLKAVKEYQDAFASAFPGEKDPVNYDNLQKAIGAFERTLLTPSSFDNFLKGDLTAMTAEEKTGLRTFIDAGCPACHNGEAIGGTMFQKFGIGVNYMTLTNSRKEDIGREKITKQEADKNVFKVPGLRNIAMTYPYFHDGSVNDLSQAVAIMGKAQLNKTLTVDEIQSIVTFLNALTGKVPQSALQNKDMAIR